MLKHSEYYNIGICGKNCKECQEFPDCNCRTKECIIRKCALTKKHRNCSWCNESRLHCDYLHEINHTPIDVFRHHYPRRIVNAIFNYNSYYLVDGKDFDPAIFCDETTFYKELYQIHDDEDSYKSALQYPEINCQFIVGPVGSGKTTYFGKVLFNEHICNYVYINLMNHRSNMLSLAKDEQGAFVFFNKLIKDSICDSILKFKKNDQISSQAQTLFDTYRRVDDQYTIRCVLFDLVGKLHTESSDSMKNRIFENFTGPEHLGTAIECYPERKVHKAFDETVDLVDLLIVMPLFFKDTKMANLPYAIVFDNLDELDLRYAASYILTILSGQLLKYRQTIIRHNLTMPYKADWYYTIAIRNENIERLHSFNAFTINASLITLDDTTRIIAKEAKFKKHLNGVNDEEVAQFIKNMLTKRVNYLKHIMVGYEFYENEFFKNYIHFLERICDNHTVMLSGVDVFQLCNNSLRLFTGTISSMIESFTLHHLKAKTPINPEKSTLESYLWKIIWGELEISVGDERIKNKLIDNIVYDYQDSYLEGCCEIHRLILTYLSHDRINGVLFDNILNHMKAIFNIEEIEVRQAVLNLTKRKKWQANLITISQNESLNTINDIQKDSILFIEPRGEVFIDKLLINIDFFIMLHSVIVSKEEHLPLNSCDLKTASDHLKLIVAFIDEYNTKYMKYIQDIQSTIWNNKERVKRQYKRWFLYGNESYIGRIVSSHIHAIKNFCLNALQGPDTSLILPEQYIESHNNLIMVNYIKKFNDSNPVNNLQFIEGREINLAQFKELIAFTQNETSNELLVIVLNDIISTIEKYRTMKDIWKDF
ncbi:MAG TPA: DUF3795 domain-containing protein [Candidatus Cloacimonadota bacterium]|nr:DUF3795 domain-containing protein [Candidatus Cloacimonadota bacterium]